ncbi:hypothetical protein P053_02270 [Brucella abortus 01-4165]|uniref:DUF6456 domain-containing protein n=5 Tax=Brucella TaxID=234 RepID=A0AAI8H7G1_BRUSS|nr:MULTISPECIES: DUF6456 domain-containing protein [Brucella]ERT85457.1 hypothetical protein P050_00630 [Brucella abortus 90-12178]ERT98251.1 hypothetical protein P038_02402 [Brucella abortus 99-9971-135]ERU00835.1 hypothetical protein P039_02808 [Brucella abortus 07-0994-2411]KEX98929.1 hypothetical protein IL60_0210635 [Brucella inopinata BO1]KFH23081.1 hypothetical protein IB60_00235 [Brucella abortus LMN1]KFH25386.1 hypothetical protein IB61_07695 [Brucella abortus LMN2]
MTRQISAAETRIIRFLKQGGCELQDSVRETHALLVGEQGTIAASRLEIERMRKAGTIQCDGQRIALSAMGRKRPKEQKKPTLTAASVRETYEIEPGEKVEINPAESPLAMLYRRRNADGRAFISEDEFRAGERLRADFTRGSLMPSVTSRWDVQAGSGGHYGAGGMAELTDIALASRIRVERALEAVGPELSGILIDVCCFLKGLETVERERQWPVRSAKVLLKAGLAMLHRHYNPPREGERRRGAVLHWGAEDYRPEIRPRSV